MRHLKCGTTFASYFATIHNRASKELVDIIQTVGQRAYVGKVNMDRNAPDFYIEKTDEGCDHTENFIQHVLSLTSVGRSFLGNIKSKADSDTEGCKGENATVSDSSSSSEGTLRACLSSSASLLLLLLSSLSSLSLQKLIMSDLNDSALSV